MLQRFRLLPVRFAGLHPFVARLDSLESSSMVQIVMLMAMLHLSPDKRHLSDLKIDALLQILLSQHSHKVGPTTGSCKACDLVLQKFALTFSYNISADISLAFLSSVIRK